ncbi:hypothetical protein VTO73DRAFT_4620 [Trametes versicolor]
MTTIRREQEYKAELTGLPFRAKLNMPRAEEYKAAEERTWLSIPPPAFHLLLTHDLDPGAALGLPSSRSPISTRSSTLSIFT